MDVVKKAPGAPKPAGPINEAEQKRQAELMKQASIAVQSALGEQASAAGRRVFFARHGERMDRVFPAWTRLSYTESGNYKPYDMNMPISMVPRLNGVNDFYDDPPITELGYFVSQLIGRGAKLNCINFDTVYCSPALRCAQSAHGMLKAFTKTKPKICIEPGLFEYMGWYKEENLNFLSTLEMAVQGYEVDPDYFPVISCEDLKTKYKNETIEEYYKRTGDVISSILSRHTKSPCNILFVVHAPTLDAGSRFLTKKTANVPDLNDLKQVGVHYPFGSVVALEENKSDNTWKLMHCALPSISFLDCTNRIDFKFFNRP
ncbi:putative ubiquitin associated and SH3 domain-containing protein A [Trichinella spiralis]|uniref:putative ubiquitin associated and SH3 domain-containing protein A n=1 Tax=Trichinella spiralis TaxID=6334 RepID=UPI0001EFC758|nr:putative ubiquitin associated and SH3 domain-containing protein A [Trichinella spiralis]